MNSDDLNSLNLPHELASAYVDGDVTAAERAQVEATPELLALAATMRHAATATAAVRAPSKQVRKTAIAAAMAEFDSLHRVSNVVSLASRRRWPNAVLATAAGFVLVGVVGISVLNSGTDNKSSADQAGETKLAGESTEDAVVDAAPTAVVSEILEASGPVLDVATPAELRALVVPPSADESPADTTAAGGDTGAGNDDGDDSQRFDVFNADAVACMTDSQIFLADIWYQGTLAIAVRDTVTGVTEAIDDTCAVLARVSP